MPLAGRRILVTAHGNSLRSIVMTLDHLTREQVLQLNLGTGVPYVYTFDQTLKGASKLQL